MSSDTYDNGSRYEGFSDYNKVSRSVAESIDDAVDAYALIQSSHAEDERVKPDLAAEGAGRILGAAIRLLPELEQDQDDVKEYGELLDDWKGDEGYIERLKDVRLSRDCPDWLGEFVVQIRRAGWELGYLQAGRTVKQEPDDPVEADTEAMFDNL
jgi:hypothetical protein